MPRQVDVPHCAWQEQHHAKCSVERHLFALHPRKQRIEQVADTEAHEDAGSRIDAPTWLRRCLFVHGRSVGQSDREV